MKPLRVLALGALLLGAAGGAYLVGRVSAQQALVTPDEINTVEVVQGALPAVVRIDVRLRREALQPGDEPVEVGSGFFYKRDLIVTNYHVIRDQEAITVTLANGKQANARVEATDPGIDIALLRVQGVTAPGTLAFGQSARLVPGQKLVAIGTPLRFQNFVSAGVFSVLASARDVPRSDGLAQEVGQYVATTASIQQGGSGSPVLDSRGAVVAVAVANAAPNLAVPGVIGLAIPGDLVAQSVDDLEKVGAPQRGTLGATLVDLADLEPALLQFAGLTSTQGALVDEVAAGSAASRADLRGSLRNAKGQLLAPLGDVIVGVDGQAVQNSFDVTRLIAAKRPGQTVELTVWRERQRVRVPVTLLARTAE
ncbi:serine protease, S1-C subfamily, contains C-terminal PDZ domain [Deinococcus reticulitermitis]|uniref:Serine protease, S1-C subfamily, contains C-terminal PDZ domain n=1 Tax=Deinococcus reticulitermitis TaxID=856736 RepID=A0A1H6YZN8_9DEIO|nr:S1C family serine protease [Deinococcus reticulitermitis]SEJ44577.1 serine protease, S1-C subfamily, contains C-terminal PDZ domain [Deinococcus reticulitermitis]